MVEIKGHKLILQSLKQHPDQWVVSCGTYYYYMEHPTSGLKLTRRTYDSHWTNNRKIKCGWFTTRQFNAAYQRIAAMRLADKLSIKV